MGEGVNFESCTGRHVALLQPWSLGQFKSAKLRDEEYTINAPIFSQQSKKKKEIDAPHF